MTAALRKARLKGKTVNQRTPDLRAIRVVRGFLFFEVCLS